MKPIVVSIGVALLLIIAILALDFGGLQWFKFMEPQREDARHEVFKKTRAYNEAKLQELVKYKYEYSKADKDVKEVLEKVIRHAFAEYDENQLTPELRDFVKKIKYGE